MLLDKETITQMGKARLWEVVLPYTASDLVSPEVKSAELDLGNRQLLGCCEG